MGTPGHTAHAIRHAGEAMPSTLELLPQILVIAEDDRVRLAAQRMLERCGAIVTTATTGAAALRLASVSPFNAYVIEDAMHHEPTANLVAALDAIHGHHAEAILIRRPDQCRLTVPVAAVAAVVEWPLWMSELRPAVERCIEASVRAAARRGPARTRVNGG